MASATYHRFAYRARMSPGRRAVALALAIALVALVILALIRLGVIGPRGPEEQPFSVTFQIAPPAPVAGERTHAREGARPANQAAPRQAERPAARAKQPPPPIPSPSSTPTPPKLLTLDHDSFAASDIGHLPSHAGEGAGEAGEGKDSRSVYGPGEGPGGARLYDAEWYREPTHAEMAYYLPAGGAPPGWAMVACQTAPDYRVENCRELGEAPLGSGLSRALRQASWQFRVRPPRLNGRAMIGAWVRIRFDFTLKDAAKP